ncbi:MAG: DUF3391 domain-containing protein [gamma proteobacterium symbiont of Bathyaustriella thionipta]|nr:DUF3391 domain-containing protein [gamma proteobacterium symbiont of Bathyaustriella thionipta]MCU7950941.1 DUF3391 domain-containing protein [gamma proteobacterium symbiont of Bathyaustriella thionipta]MCU7953161.1 DUF3391 domain-containing protein [gamma proteobacterium symbiont of Bathyaustriella thionipta]MCU7957432.1 DUF3391 domain-containing protein [gamma proteobacterium symbiont of Bathyaustriella thionipta]MCU7968928.1 DUF3391 domain-containing protein [gamma proteobacterium symbion
MSTRKITVSQLCIGMFIHELDVPWMKSPFLRHRRKIKTDNDVALLKQAGVKTLTIDLSRGLDIQTVPPLKEHTSSNTASDIDESSTLTDKESSTLADKASLPDQPVVKNKAAVPLVKELKAAKVLQGKICTLVNQLSSLVQQGRPISAASISPIIQDSVESISRNDQALLTLLHLHRQDLKLSDHAFGVFALILPLAIKLECSKKEINELGMAALLHDIGWVRLPMHLLDKKSLIALQKNN